MKQVTIFLYMIVFIFLALALDYVSVRLLESKPFLSYKVVDGDNEIYRGVIYKVYYCKDASGAFIRSFKNINNDYACPVVKKTIKQEDYKIIYEVDNLETDDTLETEYYICTFKGTTLDKVFLKYTDGNYLNINTVINRKMVTIESLINHGVSCEAK